VARLPPQWENGSHEGIQTLMQNASIWRTRYRRAGVILELADYAEGNGDGNEAAIIAALRRDATAIRIQGLKHLARVA
jgi:hypothetical protein